MEIADNAASLPDEKERECYNITKEDLISRLISVNNNLDGIILDIESADTANSMNNTMTVVGGGIPMGQPMF